MGKSSPDPPSTVTTTQTQEPPAHLLPFLVGGTTPGGTNIPAANSFLERAFNLSRAAYPFGFSAANAIAPFNPLQQQAFSLGAQQALRPPPELRSALSAVTDQLEAQQDPGSRAFLQDVLAGSGGLLDRSIASAQGNIVDQFNTNVVPGLDARFALSGTAGGTAHTELDAARRYDLARALGETETSLRSAFLGPQLSAAQTQIGADLSRQGQTLAAAQSIPGLAQAAQPNIQALLSLGGQQQARDQALRDFNYQKFIESKQFPFQQNQQFGQLLGLGGGGTTITGQYPFIQPNTPSFGQQLLLGGLGAAFGGLGGGIGSGLAGLLF